MKIHIKDRDNPVRELTFEEVKFEYRNKIISRSALYWKVGMKEWARLDQMPELNDVSIDSPKEERLGENWLYRQIDARRNFSEAPNLNQSRDATTKWTWEKILSSTGFILVYIFACSLFTSSAITRNENHNPTLGVLLGLILFRRIFRLQSEKTITQKPDRSFSRFYLHASAWASAKWFVYLIPVYIFAVLDAETSSYLGTNLGKCLGLYICTLILGLDVPVWTWRKRNEYTANGYPRKNLAWAVVGGVGIPASIYAVIFLFIPAFQSSMERARMVNEAFEASKAAEAQTNATPAPWSPPAEELIDPQLAVSGAPTEFSSQQRVYGKSKAYSLILPPEWDVTNDMPGHDFTASGAGLNFDVIYHAENSKTPLQAILTVKNRLQKNGAFDFTEPYTIYINGLSWTAINCKIIFRGQKSGNMTCMAYKNTKGLFILMYGSLLYPEKENRAIFDPIVKSFKIE